MLSRIWRSLFILVLMLFSVCYFFAMDVYAEAPVVCRGKVYGETFPGPPNNVNAGQIWFDTHPGPTGDPMYNELVSLEVLGIAEDGFAPDTRHKAACVEFGTEVTVPSMLPMGGDEYAIMGWAFSDNVGFVSFYCDGVQNQGVDCGFPHGVKIGAEDGGGNRALSGFAFNNVLGYIQFKSNPGDPVPYGVVMDSDGHLSGYAWSTGGIWINFEGVSIILPEEDVDKVTDNCDGVPYVCIEIVPDPFTLGNLKEADLSDVLVANGVDEYEVHMYLREGDGVTPMDIKMYNLEDMVFNWLDTVKIDQWAGEEKYVETDLNDETEPWPNGLGGVVYKPVDDVIAPTTYAPDKWGSFTLVDQFEGHWVLNKTIRSYAPTTNSNISFTTSTNFPIPFNNELFYSKLTEGDSDYVWSDYIEPNSLVLKNIQFSLTNFDGTPVLGANGLPISTVIYPNMYDNLPLKFRPAYEINPLFKDSLEDEIIAFRGIPMNFTVGVAHNGLQSFGNLVMKLKLDYDKIETEKLANCNSDDIGYFNFNFYGTTQTEKTLGSEFIDANQSVYAIATLPSYDEENPPTFPCEMAVGPTLYSEVSYSASGDGHSDTIKYYSNKLPRLISSVINPTVTVHGNIVAFKAFSPTADQVVQETGNILGTEIRDTVKENIDTLLGDAEKIEYSGDCTIQELDSSPVVMCGSTNYGSYVSEIGDGEKVLYFQGEDTNVRLNLSAWDGKWVVVTVGGKVFIDGDIYDPDGQNKLVLIQLRPYDEEEIACEGSNVYISTDVKNIQAAIVSDCSIFSYDTVLGSIDPSTGLVDWGDSKVMTQALEKNQLFIQGSLYSRNTIGGADLDKDPFDPKNYLLLGTGEVLPITEVTEKEIMEAQMYDLNYLRVFRLKLEMADNGLPIDQWCDLALSIENMIQIRDYINGVEGVEPLIGKNGNECNGIDPVNKFISGDSSSGDLVPPQGGETLSQGLNNESQFDPVYVFYVTIDSAIFTSQ